MAAARDAPCQQPSATLSASKIKANTPISRLAISSLSYFSMQIFSAVEPESPSLGRLGGKVDKLRGWWGRKVTDRSGTRQEGPQPSAPAGWSVTADRVPAHKGPSGNHPPRAFPIDCRAKSGGLHLSPDGRRCDGGGGRAGGKEFLGQFISY